jgi:hypothetical protein
MYRQHENNMSRNLEKMRNFRLLAISKNAARYQGLSDDTPDLIRRAYFTAYRFFGRSYFWHLDMERARQDLSRAIKLNPRAWNCYLVFAKSLLGARLNQRLRRAKARLTVSP